MKIRIGSPEEWYPYYSVAAAADDADGESILESSDADGKRWIRAEKAFRAAQRELADLYKHR